MVLRFAKALPTTVPVGGLPLGRCGLGRAWACEWVEWSGDHHGDRARGAFWRGPDVRNTLPAA